MKNGFKSITAGLLICFYFSFIFSVFCAQGNDHSTAQISFQYHTKEDATGDPLKELFVTSFMNTYQDITPNQLKDHFKTLEDVRTWLTETFHEEWAAFKKDTSVHCINVFKEGKLIGFALVQELKNEPRTWHIRQMAFLPNEQRKGYGEALIKFIQENEQGVPANRLIADVRKLNFKARPFYKKMGFQELNNAHDPDLRKTGKYVGLEWKRS